MKKVILAVCIFTASILIFSAIPVKADDGGQDDMRSEMMEQQEIYGSEMMTNKERAEYRAKMRAAKTMEEREMIRKEHHERMKVRAKERGIMMPDDPPHRGMRGGMGSGGGMGQGGR